MGHSSWGRRVLGVTAFVTAALLAWAVVAEGAQAQRRRRHRRERQTPDTTQGAGDAAGVAPGRPDPGAAAGGGAAQPAQPAPRPPPEIVIVARDDESLVFLDDAFAPARFAELVALSATTEEGGEEGPVLESQVAARAAVQPVERGSIDQELLTQIIVDRTRRLAMRAVADAIGEATGPVVRRRYVQDLIVQIGELLTDRSGMQNTRIEALISMLVRAVLSDAIVRMRFGAGGVLDPCAWRRNVYAESDPPDDAAACRSQAITELAAVCTGETAPYECALGRGSGAEWVGFLPAGEGAHESLVLRAYLMDLAYWALGRLPLFASRTRFPECAYRENHPNRTLCRYAEGGEDDGERAARVAALLGVDDAFSGIEIAQDLMHAMRPPADIHLATLVEAFANRPSLGNFRSSYLLTTPAWRQFEALEAWATAWKDVQALSRTVSTLETDTTNLAQSVARVKSAAAAFEASALRACTATAPNSGFRRAIEPIFCPGSSRSVPQATPDDPCSGAPRTLLRWARFIKETDRADRAAEQPIGQERLAALCVPAELVPILDRTHGNGARARAFSSALDQVQADASALRSALDAYADASIGGPVADLQLARRDELIALLAPIAEAMTRLHAGLTGPDLLPVSRYGSVVQGNAWLRELRDCSRATGGLTRLLRLSRLLPLRVLRERDLVTLGDLADVLRGLGGEGAILLERLGPVLAFVDEDQTLGVEVMLLLLERIPVEEIVLSLGVAPEVGDWCEEDESGLPCWMNRVLLVLREATDVDEERVAIDGNRLVKTLGAMGDDFRRRNSWRGYFHLTIGIGELAAYSAGDLAAGRITDVTPVPIMAEQIGIGFASPSFWGDAATFRFGLFGSGLLYRAVLDNEESNAVMFGAFLAMDVYELLEFYVAPMVLFYPPDGEDTRAPGYGLAAGVQIPLGDYLAEL